LSSASIWLSSVGSAGTPDETTFGVWPVFARRIVGVALKRPATAAASTRLMASCVAEELASCAS
jgi:hypothetical protein